MTKYFTHPVDGRIIEVKIDKDENAVDFKFKNGLTFYDIPLHEWKESYPFWQDHLKHKNWFTPEIESFLNTNAQS